MRGGGEGLCIVGGDEKNCAVFMMSLNVHSSFSPVSCENDAHKLFQNFFKRAQKRHKVKSALCLILYKIQFTDFS